MVRHQLWSRITAAILTMAAGGAAQAETEEASETREASRCDPLVRVAATMSAGGGQMLAAVLAELPPLEATHVAAELALSPGREPRLALANALGWTFRLGGDDLMIDHLSHDADPAIRRSAARAAWARRAAGGDAGVLARLTGDPNPSVREIAELAGASR